MPIYGRPRRERYAVYVAHKGTMLHRPRAGCTWFGKTQFARVRGVSDVRRVFPLQDDDTGKEARAGCTQRSSAVSPPYRAVSGITSFMLPLRKPRRSSVT